MPDENIQRLIAQRDDALRQASHYERVMSAAIQERDTVARALAELVRLKDLKTEFERELYEAQVYGREPDESSIEKMHDYSGRKHDAWDEARAVLKEVSRA